MKYLTFLSLCILISSCSGFSSSEDINEAEIIEMLEDIRIAFNLADIDQIMSHYHSEYFHNGDLYEDEIIRWESRLNNYVELDITGIDIDLDDGFAIAYFTLILRTSDNTESWSEPSDENGDISYLIFNSNTWEVYGNQIDPNQFP